MKIEPAASEIVTLPAPQERLPLAEDDQTDSSAPLHGPPCSHTGVSQLV